MSDQDTHKLDYATPPPEQLQRFPITLAVVSVFTGMISGCWWAAGGAQLLPEMLESKVTFLIVGTLAITGVVCGLLARFRSRHPIKWAIVGVALNIVPAGFFSLYIVSHMLGS